MTAALLLAIGLAVEPAELRPVPGAQALVRVTSPVRPALSASAGTLDEARPDGEGRWIARFVPPAEAVPQVALLSAVAGGEVAFAALRLFGMGDAEVRTRPNGRISVTIGTERFGPVKADARGVAEVPVVVPPGVGFAMNGARPIDLHVPRTRTLMLALAAAEAPADVAVRLELRLFAVDAAGAPRTGARIVLRPGAGVVEPLRELGQGVYAATWSLPRQREGRDELEAFLEEAPALASRASVQRRAGAAATIVLTPSRERLVAGEGELTVEAILLDAAGNPARDELQVSSSGAGETRVEPQGPGAARAHVPVPSALGGATELRLSFRSARGTASAALALPLSPAAPAQARLALGSASVHADGRGPVPLQVRIDDRFGNPVDQAELHTEAEGGRVSAPAAQGAGTFGALYTPPLLREPGSAVLRVRAGSAAADLRVPLLPSQTLFALAPKLGALTNLGRVTSPLFALEGGVRFEALGTQFAALAETGWFFASHSDALAAAGQPLSARSRADFVSFATGLSWRPFVMPRTQAFFSLGPSLLLQRGTQQFAGQPSLVQSALTPGAFAAVGAELRLGRFVPLAELRWSWHRDAQLFAVQNPVRGVALSIGSRFELP